MEWRATWKDCNMENMGGKIRSQAMHIVVKVASAAEILSFINGRVTSKYVLSSYVPSNPGRCFVLYFVLECWQSLDFHLQFLVHKCWEAEI